jgi:hypothetical protein
VDTTARFLVFLPGSTLHRTFDTYQQAWEFAEFWFREGNGIALIEQITQKTNENHYDWETQKLKPGNPPTAS